VEADETYLAKSPKTRKPEGAPLYARNEPQVMSLVERGGNIRSIYLDDKNIRGALDEHLDSRSRLVTDGSQSYKFYMPTAEQHESVDHSKYEWKRGDVHTNTLEGFFSIFKRGLVGVYQHMDKKHLDRYLAEFDFRMNTRAKLGIDNSQRPPLRWRLLRASDSPIKQLIRGKRLSITQQLVFEWMSRVRNGK